MGEEIGEKGIGEGLVGVGHEKVEWAESWGVGDEDGETEECWEWVAWGN